MLSYILIFVSVALSIFSNIQEKFVTWVFLLQVAITIIIFFLQNIIHKFTDIGASCRHLFDYKLFGFNPTTKYGNYTEDEIYELAVGEKHKNKKKYDIAISHKGTDKERGVKFWYKLDSSWPINKAIMECQKQNVFWDKKLTAVVCGAILIVNIVTISLLVIINLNSTLLEIIINIFGPMFLLVEKDALFVQKCFALYKLHAKMNTCFNADESTPEARQELIEERRRLDFIVPNFLHHLFSDTLHAQVNDLVS